MNVEYEPRNEPTNWAPVVLSILFVIGLCIGPFLLR